MSTDRNVFEPVLTVPCKYCSNPTRSTGTMQCDRCWEIAERVRRFPELARKVLREMSREKSNAQ
jgi:tRNA(Ile2) C34 agmatinyltransferase TiaS